MATAFLRPDADEADGGWTNEAGSNTNLFASIDESSLNDSDFIKSSSDDDKVRLRLSDPGAAMGSPAVVRYRCKSGSDTGVALTGRLYQGTGPGTLVAYWETALTDTYATYTYDLSAVELALISDANDLYIEFEKVAEAPHLQSQIDLNFSAADYYESGNPAAAVTDLLSISRASSGYAATSTGGLTLFSNDTLRITDLGLLIEPVKTNVVLWNRDLTNAAWTKTNMTAAKDQTGPDGVSNSASSITATAGNGTALQSITLASSFRIQTAYIKRITGTGTINMTMDNGATWTVVTATASWARVPIPNQTLANPIVGFRVVTSGDAIAVDFVQNEDWGSTFVDFVTSPIPTTTAAATRAADQVLAIGGANTVLTASTVSVLADVKSLVPVTNMNGQNQYWRIIGDDGTGTGKTHLFANTNDTIVASYDGSTVLQATLGNSLTFSGGVKVAAAQDGSTRSVGGGGGTVATDANHVTYTTSASIGYDVGFRWSGYIRRVTAWNSRLSDATLQSLTAP